MTLAKLIAAREKTKAFINGVSHSRQSGKSTVQMEMLFQQISLLEDLNNRIRAKEREERLNLI